ncbi:hypothetical protein TKK_0000635 [Trichogramma kaykai]|uniref:Uncharacterized protein n=1 Tax=Trichogramma kaykai TaxID=54128 RepID=A0ABD2W0U8_9HYME
MSAYSLDSLEEEEEEEEEEEKEKKKRNEKDRIVPPLGMPRDEEDDDDDFQQKQQLEVLLLRQAPSFDLSRGRCGANNEIGRDQLRFAESSVRENAFSGGKDEKSSSARCPNASATRTSVDEEKPIAAAAAAAAAVATTTNDLQQQQQQQDKKFGKVSSLPLQRCSSANSVAATHNRMNKRPASYLELYSRRFSGSSKDVTTTDPGPTKVTTASSHERQSSISGASRSGCSRSCASSSICDTDRTSSNEFGSRRRRAVVVDEKPRGATNLGSVLAVDDDSGLHREQRSRSRPLLCDSSWDYGTVKRDRSQGSNNGIDAVGPNKQQHQEQIDLDAKVVFR